MPRYKNSRKTWRYSDEFKIKAVEMSLQDGIPIQQVAEGLGIHPFMLSRWRKEYREGKFRGDRKRRIGVTKGKDSPSPRELSKLKQLEKENARLIHRVCRGFCGIFRQYETFLRQRVSARETACGAINASGIHCKEGREDVPVVARDR